MLNVKISQKHGNVYYIRNNSTLKSIYDIKNECTNYTLSLSMRQRVMLSSHGEIMEGLEQGA